MSTVNKMSTLLDKIERRLGVRFITESNPEIGKAVWDEVIYQDTMDTFSRYFPHKYDVILNESLCKYHGDGYYILNEHLLDPLDIIGVGDIDWRNTYNRTKYNSYGGGVFDMYNMPSNPLDLGLIQTGMDMASLFNMNVYVSFVHPNMLKLNGYANSNIFNAYQQIPLTFFVKHKNLTTIAPTKMEIFEKLAIADVAKYLLGELKHFDGYETPYGDLDLKLDDLRAEAEKRDSIIEELESGYVNPANTHQSMIMTI